MSLRRIILAYVLAPLVTPLGYLALAVVGGEFRSWADVPPLLGYIGLFAYSAAILLGVPLLLFYRRLHWTNWMPFTLGGAAIGFAVGLFVGNTVKAGPVCSTLGAMSALAFWLIAYRMPYRPQGQSG